MDATADVTGNVISTNVNKKQRNNIRKERKKLKLVGLSYKNYKYKTILTYHSLKDLEHSRGFCF